MARISQMPDAGPPSGSEYVPVVQDGANRKALYRLPFYNVADYGAVGDGVANDTAALQAVLDAVNAAGGGTAWLPTGDYRIHDPVNVWANTRLLGAGVGAVRIVADGSMPDNVEMLNGGARNNIEVAGFELDGNKGERGTSSVTGEGLEFDGSRLWFHHLWIHDTPSEGIDSDNGSLVFVSDVLATNCGGNGIHLSDPSQERSVVSNCIVVNCAHARSFGARTGGLCLRGSNILASGVQVIDSHRGVYIEPVGGPITLNGVQVQGDEEGIRVFGDNEANLAGCVVESNTALAVMVDVAGVTLNLSGGRYRGDTVSVQVREGRADIVGAVFDGPIRLDTNGNVVNGNVVPSVDDNGAGNIVRHNSFQGA